MRVGVNLNVTLNVLMCVNRLLDFNMFVLINCIADISKVVVVIRHRIINQVLEVNMLIVLNRFFAVSRVAEVICFLNSKSLFGFTCLLASISSLKSISLLMIIGFSK